MARSEIEEVQGVAKNSQRAANGYHRATRNADERAAPCKQRQPASKSSKQQIESRKKRLASRLQEKRTDHN